MRFRKFPAVGRRTFVLVFDRGDEAVMELERFAVEHRIAAASLQGIGALSDAVLGFYDPETKGYRRIPVGEQVELLSLLGNIALVDGRPKLHAHVVVGKADGTAHGGHLLEAHVWPTLEVVLVAFSAELRRVHDPEIGLPLIEP